MDMYIAAVAVALIIAGVVAYAVNRVNSGKAEERRIKHEEFKASLNLNHDESMAKILSNREVEIAKATGKPPSTVLDGESKRLS